MKRKFAVFISGYGRGAINIIKNYHSGLIQPKLSLLLSNNPDSFALKIADKYDIPTCVIENKSFDDKDELENQILVALKKFDIDYIFLAGWRQIIGPHLLSHYKDKIVNIHPSLLPSFKGLNAIDQAMNAGVKVTGVTTHFVDDSLDGGKIIGQKSVGIDEDDNFNTLDSKIFKAGTKLQLETINSIFKSD